MKKSKHVSEKSKGSEQERVIRLLIPIGVVGLIIFLILSEFIWTLVGLGLIGWTAGKIVKSLNQRKGIAV